MSSSPFGGSADPERHLPQPGQLTEHGLWDLDTDAALTNGNGDLVLQDIWPTRREARPDVWKVSPDMKGESPASTPEAD
jgi:hypothetical protein